MKYFQILLTLVFYSFFAVSCDNKNDLPLIPEPPKWVDADFGLKNSWLKIADNGSKMFIMGRSELTTVDKNGVVESRHVLPASDIYQIGLGKDVHFWTAYEGTSPFLYLAPNNNPDRFKKISLDIFDGRKIYAFGFSSGGAPELGYFNSQNQLLFFGNTSDSINHNFYITIDVVMNSDKTDFVDCRILDKQLFHFPSWSLGVLKGSKIIDDRIYWVDYSSTMRFENGVSKVIFPLPVSEYGLDILKWKEKLYIPSIRFNLDNTELRYVSSSDNGLSWIQETARDTILPQKIEVVNNKLVAFTNSLSRFWFADDLVGFKKMNTEGLPQTNYQYAQFYYFGGYYYIFVDNKAYRIEKI